MVEWRHTNGGKKWRRMISADVLERGGSRCFECVTNECPTQQRNKLKQTKGTIGDGCLGCSSYDCVATDKRMERTSLLIWSYVHTRRRVFLWICAHIYAHTHGLSRIRIQICVFSQKVFYANTHRRSMRIRESLCVCAYNYVYAHRNKSMYIRIENSMCILISG